MMTPAAIQAPLARSLATATGQHAANAVKNAARSNSFMFNVTTGLSPTSGGRRFAVAASRPTKEEANSTSKSDDSYMSEDDVSFLLKLGAGSIAGAAAIKYGSVLLPEITRPNIIQALIMISTPVIVSVLILIKQSSVQQ